LLRLTSTGLLDTTFDTDGKAIYDMNNTNDEAYGMAINSNNDLAIAGTAVSAASDLQILVIEE
jgi:hypothetical protein